jgi:beta-N-acetylhexosaminidase
LRAADLLWAGFAGQDAGDVGWLPEAPGGVILFARNLDPDPVLGPARCRALLDGLQARWGAGLPLAVAVDQEGGAVSRLRPWVGETPSFRAIRERGGAAACEAWGRLWGEGLAMLGFTVDFAPVADLWDGNPGTGMGDRCASTDPVEVATAVGAFLHGLESTGVRGCLKHFPGLGGTTLDSHKGLPELEDDARIAANARAFQMLANEDRLVMVAHLKTPATEGLPASLHRGSVAENPWRVAGRFLPDDLEMGGVAGWSWDDRVRLSLEAGNEWLLVCQSEAGVGACFEAASRLPEGLWKPAVARSRRMRENLPRTQSGPLDLGVWQAWVDRVHRAAPR